MDSKKWNFGLPQQTALSARVPRQEVWGYFREHDVPEKYVRLVNTSQDQYRSYMQDHR